jgi:DNA helicase-2/ATP-dependent DNA helicase PcrA
VIREDDIEDLLKIDTGLETKVLRFKNSNKEEMNFGLAKGLTFDRVIIYPTDSIVDWIKGGDDLKDTTRAKFYVALTRSRYSSFIVCDYLNKENFIDGIGFFTEKDTQTCLFV